jgi:hypothetical protein
VPQISSNRWLSGFHRAWNQSVTVRHPSIWKFLRSLKDEQANSEVSVVVFDTTSLLNQENKEEQLSQNILKIILPDAVRVQKTKVYMCAGSDVWWHILRTMPDLLALMDLVVLFKSFALLYIFLFVHVYFCFLYSYSIG